MHPLGVSFENIETAQTPNPELGGLRVAWGPNIWVLCMLCSKDDRETKAKCFVTIQPSMFFRFPTAHGPSEMGAR